MSILSKLTGVGISKKGIKIDPLKAAMTALTVGSLGAGGALGGLSKLGALKKVAGSFGSGGGDTAGMLGQLGATPGRFRQIGGFLKNNAGTIADLGKAGEGIYDRYQENQQYNDGRDAYNQAAPLRQAGQAGLLDTSRPDVSSVFADPMNPQGRYRRVSVGSRGGY